MNMTIRGRGQLAAIRLLVCITALCSSASHASTLLYSNTFDPNKYPSHLTGFFSDNSPQLGDTRIADDFVLAQDGRIETVAWYGYTPGFSDFDARFLIHIYEPELTSDGTNIVPASQPLMTWTIHDASIEDSGYWNGSQISYHEAELPTSLVLEAGNYWLSVQGDFDGAPLTPLLFVWSHGFSANSISDAAFVNHMNGNGWAFGHVPERNHHAFSLHGTVVPLPGAFWLLAFALACAIRMGRLPTI